jgi:chromosome segregation ATPase
MVESRLDNSAQRLDSLADSIENNLHQLASIPANQRWTLNGQIDGQLNDFRTILGKMKADARSLAPTEREIWNGNIADHEDTHARLSNAFRNSRSETENAIADTHEQNASKAGQVLGNISEAIAIGQDTNEKQEQTLVVLKDDRERLENVLRNLDAIETEADSANSRLRRMWWRGLLNKLLAWIICAVLAGIFVLSVGLKFGLIVPGKKVTPTPSGSPLPTQSPFPTQSPDPTAG